MKNKHVSAKKILYAELFSLVEKQDLDLLSNALIDFCHPDIEYLITFSLEKKCFKSTFFLINFNEKALSPYIQAYIANYFLTYYNLKLFKKIVEHKKFTIYLNNSTEIGSVIIKASRYSRNKALAHLFNIINPCSIAFNDYRKSMVLAATKGNSNTIKALIDFFNFDPSFEGSEILNSAFIFGRHSTVKFLIKNYTNIRSNYQYNNSTKNEIANLIIIHNLATTISNF